MKGWMYADFYTGTPGDEASSNKTYKKGRLMSENNITTPVNNDILPSLECRDIADLFPEASDNGLSSLQRSVFENHIAACSECRESFSAYQQVIDCAAEFGATGDEAPLEVDVQNRLRKALNQRLGLSLSYIA